MLELSVSTNVSAYLDALDFLHRMKVENKANETNVALFLDMHGAEASLLNSQGYFNFQNN